MKLVILSGRSGSGKTTALHVLEDAGYYCIDNLPAGLLPSLVAETLASDSPEHENLAVCIDARNISQQLSAFAGIIAALPGDVETSVIYLDADDETLIKRFSETRRKHPLSNRDTALAEAIQSESEILRPISDCADIAIDTSAMSFHQLRMHVQKAVVGRAATGMSLLFQSFGYKHGIPANADIVFDARCLPNPHWILSLRSQSGLDDDVIAFLDEQQSVQEMFADICHFLEKWLPYYAENNRSYTTVAVGCTGGQHRSVYLAEKLTRHFVGQYDDVQVRHRELRPVI